MTALVLLMPGTPMLFQGQEFQASAPFLYFADHKPELARARARRPARVRRASSRASRRRRCRGGSPIRRPATRFERCKLDWSERERHGDAVALHRDLLRLRREDPIFARPRRGGLDGAVLGPEAFVLRFFGEDGDDRLMLVNLGRDLERRSIPDPLVAPPEGRIWHAPLVERAPALRRRRHAADRDEGALADRRSRGRRARRRTRRAGLSPRSGRDGTLTGSGQRAPASCRSPDGTLDAREAPIGPEMHNSTIGL